MGSSALVLYALFQKRSPMFRINDYELSQISTNALPLGALGVLVEKRL